MKAKQSKSMNEVNTPKAPEKFIDRNLMKVNPLKEQFESTPAAPIPQRVRMAGGG